MRIAALILLLAAAPAIAPLPIPGKPVPGCIVPPPTKPDTVDATDEQLYGALQAGLAGKKITPDQASKDGHQIAEDAARHQRSPDPSGTYCKTHDCSPRAAPAVFRNTLFSGTCIPGG
jgi:hypothetical protein